MLPAGGTCLFIIQNLFRNVDGAVFCLFKGSAHIFSDNADAEKLYASQKQNENNDGGVARYVNSLYQFLKNHGDKVNYGSNPGHPSQTGGQPQGSGGITDDALHGVVKELPEIPLSGAVCSGLSGVGNKAGAVTHPGKDPLGEPMIFRKVQNAVPDAAAEGAEVAGIRLEGNLRQGVNNLIETTLEERKDFSLSPTVLVGGNHIIFRFIVQNLGHLPDQLRSLLQVCID